MSRTETPAERWQDELFALQVAREHIGPELTYEVRSSMDRRERALSERLQAIRQWERVHSHSQHIEQERDSR